MIRASVLGPLLRILDETSAAEALLAAHGMSRPQLDDPYAPISLARYVALFEAAATALSDPAIGLKLGLAVRAADLGPLGLLFTAAPTARIALSRFSELLAALQSGTQAVLQRKGELTAWTYRIDDAGIWPRRQDSEFSLAALCSLLKSATGPGLRPLEVQFEHTASDDTVALERCFKSPLRFAQPANRLLFSNADLDRPIATANHALATVLERHIADLLREPTAERDLSAAIRRLIALHLGEEEVTIARLSSSLGMSPRSLQRHLALEQTSVRQLLREHRQAMAHLRIQSTRHSQSEIAEALGYADGTAFWRAFKSWTDTTPSAYRKRIPGK
jgi:AraC-like DNA-binding protein